MSVNNYLLVIRPSTVLLPCLSEDCLCMARQLMLAQAQLCFYEKAVKDKKTGNMKPVIIAKIGEPLYKHLNQISLTFDSSMLGLFITIYTWI